MARTRTLADMLLDIRQRTNQEQTFTPDAQRFVTDAELTEYLNQELAELWSRLVLNEGQPHYRSTAPPISVTPPTALYDLPADFWTMQEVTATIGGETFPLTPFMAAEHGSLMSPNVYSPGCAFYRIQGPQIEFRPATRAFTAQLYYSPSQPRLVSGGDTFDGFNGYEVAAIYGVCATVKDKEESDPSFYAGQKQRIYQQIEKAAQHRDMSNPERVQDVMPREDIGFAPGEWRRWF